MTSARLAPDFALGAHTMIAFPTPIVVYRWPDSDALNKALREVILDAEKSDPGLTFSNVGGWHSDIDLFTWPQECIATLRERVQAMALELAKAASDPGRAGATASFGIDAWATTLREKLIKIGAKAVRHGRYITFQLAEVAIPRPLCAEILRFIDRLRPAPLPP